ncbi:MAG: hypothetical protein AAFX89_07320 [Pseudomonadota bacterium]
MSLPLIQIFTFMSVTFLLGLALGWSIWRFGGANQKELESATSQTDFWRKNLEQCRMELDGEKNKVTNLRNESTNLKRQIAVLKEAQS